MDIKKTEDEARKNIKKPKKKKITARNQFTNKQSQFNSSWNACNVIFTGTGPNGNEGFFSYNQDNNTYSYMPGITTSSIYPATYNWRWDVAMWDDKLYCRMKREDNHWLHSSTSCLDPVNDCPMYIEEYQIDFSTSSVTLLRQIPVLNYCSSVHPFGTLTSWSNGWQSGQGNVRYWSDQGEPIAVGHAMTMKDANTIIHGSINGPRLVGTGNWDQWIFETDISGTNGVTNALFPISTWRNLSQGGMDNGIYESVDILYIQNTDEYLISLKKIAGQAQYPERLLRLYSSSGLILDELTHTFFGLGLYISPYDSKIYITGPDVSSSSGSTIHEVTLNPLNIGPAIQNTGLIQVNGATHPNVFQDCSTTPSPTTTHCPYDIGDIGPGGGIIFALPNTGINNTPFAYEISTDAIQLATTPMSALPSECKNQKPLIVKVRQLSASFGSIPNTALRFEYGPGSQNPNFFPSDINVGDILDAFSTTGGNLFPAGSVPQVTLITLIPPSPPLFTTTHCRIDFSVAMIGPPASQPAASATFYVIPSNIPTTGAEWGGYDRPIVTSELFGEGKKNTDIISLVTQTNNPPSHPTVPSHDIAANLCLAFSQNNLDDWFLPSYEELEEAFNVLGSNGLDMLPNPPGINNEKTIYWSSSALNPVNNTLSPTTNSNEFAWSYITPFNTTFLYRKCKTLSVLPVRRFECEEEDKGIQYDYRLAKYTQFNNEFSGALPHEHQHTPGVIKWMGDDQEPTVTQNITTTETVKIVMTGNQGWPPGITFPNGIGPGVIMVEFSAGATINVGQVLDPPLAFWGPVMFTYNTTITGGITVLRAVFGNYAGGSSVSTSFASGSFQSISWTNTITNQNPNYVPSVFGNSMEEIGKQRLRIDLSAWDVRLNPLKHHFQQQTPAWVQTQMQNGLIPLLLFKIKVYNQFEDLLGDWDYEVDPFLASFCAAGFCRWHLIGNLVNTNYVNPAYAHPVHTSVVDLTHLFNRPSGNIIAPSGNTPLSSYHPTGTHDEGSGYVSIELLTTEVTAVSPVYNVPGSPYPTHQFVWSNITNPPSYFNGRGNTLNLMNWLGVGNRRVTDPNNLPPEWSTLYNRFPWGVVCMPCGHFGVGTCTEFKKREWMAELDFNPNIWVNLPFALNGNPPLLMGACGGTTFHVSHIDGGSWGAPYIGASASTSYPNSPFNAWHDMSIGNACNDEGWSPYFTDDDIQLKTINVTAAKYKDNKNFEECFETGSETYTIKIADPNSNASKKFSARKKYTNENKKPKETGPFGIMGYYPLYDTVQGAQFASPVDLKTRENEDTFGYHIHVFEGVEYYMPNGLVMGVTQFHGDYDGRIIEETEVEDIIIEPTIQIETTEQIPLPIIIPPEEDEEPPTTYTPPPSRPSSSGGY